MDDWKVIASFSGSVPERVVSASFTVVNNEFRLFISKDRTIAGDWRENRRAAEWAAWTWTQNGNERGIILLTDVLQGTSIGVSATIPTPFDFQARGNAAIAETALRELRDRFIEHIDAMLMPVDLPAAPAPRSKSPIEHAIETFYRRRARNPKITLKQVCEELGVNYASTRVAKVAYDKRRRPRKKD